MSDTVVGIISWLRTWFDDIYELKGQGGGGSGIDFDDVYPVGSVYISVSNSNPSTLFGGTWVQIKDSFLLSSGDTYSNGNTGGEATHTLSINEMPEHNHTQNSHNHSMGEIWSGGTGTVGAYTQSSNRKRTSITTDSATIINAKNVTIRQI